MCAAPRKGLFSSLKVHLVLLSVIGGLGIIAFAITLQKPQHRTPSGEPILTAVILDDSTSMLDLAVIQREGRYVLEPKIEIAKAFLRPWMETELSAHTPLVLSGLLPRAHTDREITITPETTYWAGDKEFVTFDPARVGQKVKIREYGHPAAGPIPEASLKLLNTAELTETFNHIELRHTITPLGDTLYEYAIATQQKFFPTIAAPPFRLLILTDGIDFFGAASVCEKIQALSDQHILRTDQISLHIIHYLPTTFEKNATPQIPKNIQRLQTQLSEKQQAYLEALHLCLEPYQEWVRVDVIDSARSLEEILAGATFQPPKDPATASSPAAPSSVLPEAYHYAREHQIPYIHRGRFPPIRDMGPILEAIEEDIPLQVFPYGHTFDITYLKDHDLFISEQDHENPDLKRKRLNFFRLNLVSLTSPSFELVASVEVSRLVSLSNYPPLKIRFLSGEQTGHSGLVFPLQSYSLSNAQWIDIGTFTPVHVETPEVLNHFSSFQSMILPNSQTLVVIGPVSPTADFFLLKAPQGTYEIRPVKNSSEPVAVITAISQNGQARGIEMMTTTPLPPQYQTQGWKLHAYFYDSQMDRVAVALATQYDLSDPKGKNIDSGNMSQNDTVYTFLFYDFVVREWLAPPRQDMESFLQHKTTYQRNRIRLKDIASLAPFFMNNIYFDPSEFQDPRMVVSSASRFNRAGKDPILIFNLGDYPHDELYGLTFTLPPTAHPNSHPGKLMSMIASAFRFEDLNNPAKDKPYVLVFLKDLYGIARRTYLQQQY